MRRRRLGAASRGTTLAAVTVVTRSLAVAALWLAACYDPVVLDCAVECAGPRDCAGGQVCGDDHFCAAPEVAGTCTDGTAQMRILRVIVEGRGLVVSADDSIACEAEGNQPSDCPFEVPAGDVALLAIDTHPEFRFVGWSGTSCGESPSCTVSVAESTVIGARFER